MEVIHNATFDQHEEMAFILRFSSYFLFKSMLSKKEIIISYFSKDPNMEK